MLFICLDMPLVFFLLSCLAKNEKPILVTGEDGFPFHLYFQMGKIRGIPLKKMKELLVVQSVNMYHIQDIIQESQYWLSQGSFLVFCNFSSHYLDETVPTKIAHFLAQRDIHSIQEKSSLWKSVVFFAEQSSLSPLPRKQTIQSLLLQKANCIVQWQGSTPYVLKNTFQEGEKTLWESKFKPILY